MTALTHLFYQAPKKDERLAQFKEQGVAKSFESHDDIFTAIAAILNHRTPARCVLVGSTEDMLPPAGTLDVSDVLWVEGILTFLEEQGIGFVELGRSTINPFETIPVESLRQYHKVFGVLQKAVDDEVRRLKVQNGKVPPKHGRPPYGYVKHGDCLEVDRTQAEAVAYIYSQFSDPEKVPSFAEVVKKTRARFPRKSDGTPQFWDTVKIRRILAKARMYCLGEYKFSDEQTVQAKSLRILPTTWVDIPRRLHEIRQGENGSPQHPKGQSAAKKS